VSVGNGAVAKNGDCLVVKYYGTLASNGVKFDENFTQPTAFAFTLGQGQVIQGWDQGLVGMKVGGERRLVIPANLAYGSTGSGAIPANAALVFDVRLLKIK
jgi:FKBP-type peptidyl-prolyl cis-trans isomerase